MKIFIITRAKMKSIGTLIYSMVSLLLLISCGSDDDTTVSVELPRANSLQIVSGNNQTGFINDSLASVIEVQVNDQNGSPFSGTTISLSVDEGTISSNTLITDVSGRASINWVLGESVGEQALIATAFGSDGAALVGSPIAIIAEALDLCQTFSSTEQLPIGPDATTETISSIMVTDEFLITARTVVTINLEHTFDADLDIFLVAPNDFILVLSTDNGVNGDNYTNTVFDDQASALVIDGIAPFAGAFRPEDPLGLLEGMQASGDWRLYIVDDLDFGGGTLLDWSIQLCRP